MMARKRRESAVDWISLLPDDVLVEILLRVPADGLIQLRRISKCCREVINRPDFAQTHLSRWRSRSGFACNRSNEIFYVWFDDVGGCLNANRHKLQVDSSELRDCLLGDCRDRFHCCWADLRLVDSCDGLLLIRGSLIGNCDRRMLLVCNPATRRFRLLPNCDKMLFDYPWCYPSYWKIVYDPSVRSYKVVGVSVICSLVIVIGLDPARQPAATWKEIPVPPLFRDGFVKASVSVNGKLHFLLSGVVGSSWKLQVLSINIATEEVTASLDFDQDILVEPDAFGMNGAFYHSEISLLDNNFQLWVLNDFEAPIWFRHLETIDIPRPPSGNIWKEFKLLQISEDTQRFIFMSRSTKRWNNTKIFSYEANSGRWKTVLSEGIGLESHNMQLGHVQSLIRWS